MTPSPNQASAESSVTSSAIPQEAPPRPPNPFICFRSSQQWQAIERTIQGRKAKGVAVSQAWGNLSPEERAVYTAAAETKKREHKEQYPGYKFNPRPKGRKKKRKRARNTSDGDGTPAATSASYPGDPPLASRSPSVPAGSGNGAAVDAAAEDGLGAETVSNKPPFSNFSEYLPKAGACSLAVAERC